MAQELLCTGRDLDTCMAALKMFHDDLDRASMWLLSPRSAPSSRAGDNGAGAYQNHTPVDGLEDEDPKPLVDRSEYESLS